MNGQTRDGAGKGPRKTSAERQEEYRAHAMGKLSEKEKKARRKRTLTTLAVAAVSVLAVAGITACILLNNIVWEPRRRYAAAEKLYAEEDYLGAYDAFSALGDYSDAAARADDCILQNARKLSGRESVVIGDDRTMKWFSITDDGVLMFDDEVYVGGTDVVIPDVFNGILVRAVGDKAFYYAEFMTSVVIPASVVSVGERSFFHCTGLTEVTLPDSIKTVGEYAFSGCSSLKTVRFGSGLREIGQRAFRECSALESAELPEGLTVIGVRAFNGCTSLKTVSLPSTLTTVMGYAFTDCTSLGSVTFNGAEGALRAACAAEDAEVILNCPGLVCKED